MDALRFSPPATAGAVLIPSDASSSRHAARLSMVWFDRPSARSSGLGRQMARVAAYAAPAGAASRADGSSQSGNKVNTVGDFMTRKETLLVVKPTTTVDKALEMLVEYCTSGFPVIDDNWRLVGVVSDYDFLALDSVSGKNTGRDIGFFPDVDSSWKTFRQFQTLLSKNNGKIIADVMTSYPLAVHESSDLEHAARLFLETKYHRLPVVDDAGKLVGIITRESLLTAAIQIKRSNERMT